MAGLNCGVGEDGDAPGTLWREICADECDCWMAIGDVVVVDVLRPCADRLRGTGIADVESDVVNCGGCPSVFFRGVGVEPGDSALLLEESDADCCFSDSDSNEEAATTDDEEEEEEEEEEGSDE